MANPIPRKTRCIYVQVERVHSLDHNECIPEQYFQSGIFKFHFALSPKNKISGRAVFVPSSIQHEQSGFVGIEMPSRELAGYVVMIVPGHPNIGAAAHAHP